MVSGRARRRRSSLSVGPARRLARAEQCAARLSWAPNSNCPIMNESIGLARAQQRLPTGALNRIQLAGWHRRPSRRRLPGRRPGGARAKVAHSAGPPRSRLGGGLGAKSGAPVYRARASAGRRRPHVRAPSDRRKARIAARCNPSETRARGQLPQAPAGELAAASPPGSRADERTTVAIRGPESVRCSAVRGEFFAPTAAAC